MSIEANFTPIYNQHRIIQIQRLYFPLIHSWKQFLQRNFENWYKVIKTLGNITSNYWLRKKPKSRQTQIQTQEGYIAERNQEQHFWALDNCSEHGNEIYRLPFYKIKKRMNSTISRYSTAQWESCNVCNYIFQTLHLIHFKHFDKYIVFPR